MAKRPCCVPGCPVITDQSRCPEHARGNSNQRGYGSKHQRLRAQWQKRIDAGERVACARCGQIISGPWHLDHDDDRTQYLGPSCAPCNLSAAGKAAHGLRRHPGSPAEASSRAVTAGRSAGPESVHGNRFGGGLT